MGEPDLLRRNAKLVDAGEDLVGLPTRIHDHALLRFGAPKDPTVLAKLGYWNRFYV